MSLKTLIVGLLLVSTVACASSSSDTSYVEMTPEEAMASMMELGTPGAEHGYLAETVGSWNISSEMSMGPGTPMEHASATSEIKMILGGRFMHETFKMDLMGMPFEGNLLMGYDNVTKQYQSVWVDNMTTGMTLSTGVRHEDGSFELNGTMYDAKTPNGRPTRMTTKKNADDTVLFQMYDTGPDGEEFLVMANTYTRR